jgi:phytoene dehydrogenase-like protein
MLGHSGVLFTPQAQRIDGLNEVTNADPSLAPGGKHLLMSHQALDALQDADKEIKLGIEDLHAIFPDFDKYCRILAVQVYKGSWPVNRAISGVHLDFKTPVKSLYCVGDAIKPEGWMESEGVAAGVGLLLEHLLKL